jgi:CHAT domain-containing protein
MIDSDRDNSGHCLARHLITCSFDENMGFHRIMQTAVLAGYRGVVGTMWSIMDDDAPKVADAVYAHLFKESYPDPSQTAFALQEAVKKLCNESEEKKSFLSWVPYIHVGI